MFLLLEEKDAVYLGNVVALVRGEGETAVLMADDTVRATRYAPLTLRARSEKFWRDAVYGGDRKEPFGTCRKGRSKRG